MTLPIDEVLRALTSASNVAANLVSTADRAAGMVGRGSPKWHRWRSLRLRIRAVNLEAKRPDKARALRIRAALHLAHGGAVTVENSLALLAGREPLAGTT